VPAPYRAAIYVFASDVRLENLFLRNPTIGILCENVGRLSINRLFGQPLQSGIILEKLRDTTRIDNVHFWRYWSTDAMVSNHLFEKANAIESCRNDNPHFSNIFAIGYFTGFLFSKRESAPEGEITSRFHVVNADSDSCFRDIHIEGPLTTGQITNYTFQRLKD
jgi:hypothetical protein